MSASVQTGRARCKAPTTSRVYSRSVSANSGTNLWLTSWAVNKNFRKLSPRSLLANLYKWVYFWKALTRQVRWLIFRSDSFIFKITKPEKKHWLRFIIKNLQKMRNFQSQKNRNFDFFLAFGKWVTGRTGSYAGRGLHLGPCTPGLYRGAHIHISMDMYHISLINKTYVMYKQTYSHEYCDES